MVTTQEKRKDEHIKLALNQFAVKPNDFDQIQFIHSSIPNIHIEDVDLTTTLGPLRFDTPFFINAMTGGSSQTNAINDKLSIIANETNIAIASGSVSVALKQKKLEESFKVIRKNNPTGLVFANVGAGASVEATKRAIELLEADALQIHLNAPQELVMPEGDRNFNHWLQSIEAIQQAITIPLIIKEVGFGMNAKTYQQLHSCGVKYIDVSGKGGTNFVEIENARRSLGDYDYLNDWGLSTAQSLLEAQSFRDDIQFISSGGIRNPLDMVKSFALGARIVGVSGIILNMLNEYGIDKTIECIHMYKGHLKILYTMLGAKTREELETVDFVLKGSLRDYSIDRGIVLQK